MSCPDQMAQITPMTEERLSELVRGLVQVTNEFEDKKIKSELMDSILAIWCTGMNYVKALEKPDVTSMNRELNAWYMSRLRHTKILERRIQENLDWIEAFERTLTITS